MVFLILEDSHTFPILSFTTKGESNPNSFHGENQTVLLFRKALTISSREKKMISLSWKHPILSSTCNTVTCSTTSFQFHHSCCTYPQFSLHMKACAYQLCICLNFKHKKSFFFFFFLFFCVGGVEGLCSNRL